MTDKFSSFIKEKIAEGLPGQEAHFEMSHKLRTYTPATPSTAMASSVCILLFPNSNDSFSFTLMERTSHNKNDKHRGQISLPGGKKEKNDLNASQTALRELEEEVGVHASDVELVGELTELYIPVSNFLVYPFVGITKQKPVYQKQESEVQEIFEVDIRELFDAENLKETNIKIAENITLKRVPYFELENRVVWGATAMILSEFKSLIKEYL